MAGIVLFLWTRILSPDDKIDDKSTILWATEADFLNVGNYLTKYMVLLNFIRPDVFHIRKTIALCLKYTVLNSVIFKNSSDVEGVYYLF